MPRKTKMSRAANGTGTIRKKTIVRNGRKYTYWEARVTVGFDLGSGNQIQHSYTGKTQKEVREKMQAAAVAITEGEYSEPSRLTLSEWLDIWLQDYMADKKYLTCKDYRAQVAVHIKPALGAVKLSDLAPHMIQHFYNDLLAKGKVVVKRDENGKIERKGGKPLYESAPMSAKSVRNVHGVLTKALSTAVSIGYLRSNPADKVTLPRIERKELSPLDDSHVKAFLEVAEKDAFGIMLMVILFTGLRESEAIGLTWDCVDFEVGVLKINKQLIKRKQDDGGPMLASTKNGKVRTIKPAPFVIKLLKRQHTEQSMQRLQKGEKWEGWKTEEERRTALVFTTSAGHYISPTSIRYHFKKLAVDIGVPECRVHDLRHTFAVLSLQNGDDIKTVQDALGHATAAFTLDVYGHVSERMKDDSASRMQAYIEKIE